MTALKAYPASAGIAASGRFNVPTRDGLLTALVSAAAPGDTATAAG
jgi:hypothetical protein